MIAVKTVNERIRKFLIQHNGLNGLSIQQLAEKFGTTYPIARGVLERWRKASRKENSKLVIEKEGPVLESSDVGSNVDSLVASFDLAAKVRQALRQLPYKQYREDDSFRRTFGVGIERWRSATGRPEFGAYKVELPNHHVVWCSEKTAHYLRERLKDVV